MLGNAGACRVVGLQRRKAMQAQAQARAGRGCRLGRAWQTGSVVTTWTQEQRCSTAQEQRGHVPSLENTLKRAPRPRRPLPCSLGLKFAPPMRGELENAAGTG